MKPARLCLVRHGETAWNAEGRVQGHTDVPLSEVGHAQARAVGMALKRECFDALYVSDLARTRQTIAPVSVRTGLPAQLDVRLRERHYGMFETLTYAEVKERFPREFERFRVRDPDFDFRTGETLRAFYARAVTCVAEIASRHAGGTILVVTHGGVLEMVYRRARAQALSAPRECEIPNAALNWVELEGAEGPWRILAWAERGHLDATRDDLPG